MRLLLDGGNGLAALPVQRKGESEGKGDEDELFRDLMHLFESQCRTKTKSPKLALRAFVDKDVFFRTKQFALPARRSIRDCE